uniref:CSON014743 protein n=1 Tax=Culicoides sonorensis TaxID=179676 RepID=A0A336MBK4_CULSO
MAQLITVRLTRNDNQPWGFRLQGGKDFGSPLALQKVNVGSIADKAGLLAGDALIKVNNEELFNLRHKDAQDAIVRAGASFELTVSRGGSTWKPAVTPLTSPVPTSAGVNVLTKTSLQAKPGQNPAAIGTGHNTAARPFASKEPSVKSVVNKQYNSPVAMYSDETIAETLSAQTEVLAGGVLGKAPTSTISSALNAHAGALNGSSVAPAVPTTAHLPSSISGPKPFSYAPVPAPAPVSAPKSPIAYPPPAAPAWTAPVSAPVQTAPAWTPAPAPVNEAAKAPAAQQLQGKLNVFRQPQPQSQAPTATPKRGGISGKPYNVQNVTQPKRGRGILNQAAVGRAPVCGCCSGQVRGPFITALGRIWCPEHFICVNANCKRPLADIGFVEEKGDLYCEYCFEQYLAPNCSKCVKKIKGDCLNAIGRQFHPECFTCSYCGKLFGNSPFFLEEGEPYCQNDWNELFTTKCFACGFPVEAGDRWVEALNNNYHSQCFNCTMCKKNLEGQSFYAKGGRPFCKNHAQYNYLKKKTQFIINLNISKYFNTITHIMYVNNKIKTILKFKFKH